MISMAESALRRNMKIHVIRAGLEGLKYIFWKLSNLRYRLSTAGYFFLFREFPFTSLPVLWTES